MGPSLLSKSTIFLCLVFTASFNGLELSARVIQSGDTYTVTRTKIENERLEEDLDENGNIKVAFQLLRPGAHASSDKNGNFLFSSARLRNDSVNFLVTEATVTGYFLSLTLQSNDLWLPKKIEWAFPKFENYLTESIPGVPIMSETHAAAEIERFRNLTASLVGKTLTAQVNVSEEFNYFETFKTHQTYGPWGAPQHHAVGTWFHIFWKARLTFKELPGFTFTNQVMLPFYHWHYMVSSAGTGWRLETKPGAVSTHCAHSVVE